MSTATKPKPSAVLLELDNQFTAYANAYKHYIDNVGTYADFTTKETTFSATLDALTEPMLDTSYNVITKEFNKNKQIRNNIENEMIQLQNVPNLNDSKLYLDTTIFTGICWTFIATGLLYYIIIEM